MLKTKSGLLVVAHSAVTGLFILIVLMVAQAQTAVVRQGDADNEYQTGAILWTQSSAEYRALAYQTFALAQLRLDAYLRSHHVTAHGKSGQSKASRKPPAVIVDVDETVMDNSRYQAELVLRKQPFTQESWISWCDRAEAGAVPGAVDFLNYAARRGVRVFYITNRRQPEKSGTIRNLQKLGFPNVSEETVIVNQTAGSSSKETRRAKVREHYDVALLMGDNLNDFNDDFAGKSIVERASQVDRERKDFGSRFIVVPNPMYGDWENAVYENKSRLNDDEKRSYRRAALRGL